MATIEIIVILSGMLLYNVLSWSFVAHKFYYWFLLYSFENAPQLSYIQILGLTLFVSAMWRNSKVEQKIKKEYREDDNTITIGTFLVGPWLTLLIGYLFKIIFF